MFQRLVLWGTQNIGSPSDIFDMDSKWELYDLRSIFVNPPSCWRFDRFPCAVPYPAHMYPKKCT